MKFFDIRFENIPASLAGRVVNKGIKNPVNNETINILDEFFSPYNKRLAALLGDDKWLFNRH